MKPDETPQARIHWMNRLLNRIGFHLTKSSDPHFGIALLRFNENLIDCFPLILKRLIEANAVNTVLQVGANDGLDGDPITEFLNTKKLRALLVEPQPETAARLRQLHNANELVTVVEAAISTKSGDLVLWQSDTKFFGGYRLDRITSSDRKHVERFLQSRNLPVKVSPIRVPALTISDLITKYDSQSPDVVIIDAEGFDKKILDQFDLVTTQPKLIHFEISNLTGVELAECRNRLIENGYRFALTERDATCLHSSTFNLFSTHSISS